MFSILVLTISVLKEKDGNLHEIQSYGKLPLAATIRSIADTSRDDARRGSRLTDDFSKVAHECCRLLECREVPADLVLRLEHDLCLGT